MYFLIYDLGKFSIGGMFGCVKFFLSIFLMEVGLILFGENLCLVLERLLFVFYLGEWVLLCVYGFVMFLLNMKVYWSVILFGLCFLV